MSSTKTKERQGIHLDFYETPERVIDGLLQRNFIDDKVVNVLEPSAGSGAIVRKIKSNNPNIKITAIELQDQFREPLSCLADEVSIGNFLVAQPNPIYDRIIANPPFCLAQEFIQHAYKFLQPEGQMAFLLRLPFICSVKRYSLLKELKPREVNILSQRPKFGGTNIDSCDYAWIVWYRNPNDNVTILDWIKLV